MKIQKNKIHTNFYLSISLKTSNQRPFYYKSDSQVIEWVETTEMEFLKIPVNIFESLIKYWQVFWPMIKDTLVYFNHENNWRKKSHENLSL